MSIKDVPGDKKATSQSTGADSSPMRRAVGKASPHRGGGRQAGEVAVYQYLSMIKSNLAVSWR